MTHTVRISISTLKKIFVTSKDVQSILVVLTPSTSGEADINNPNSKVLTYSIGTYENTLDNVEAGEYNFKTYAIDTDGALVGDELTGVMNVQDGIEPPGQNFHQENWETHQRLTVTSMDQIRELEYPVSMHVIVS